MNPVLAVSMMSPPRTPQGGGPSGSIDSARRLPLGDLSNTGGPDGAAGKKAGSEQQQQQQQPPWWNPLGKFSTIMGVKYGGHSEKTTASRVNTGGVEWKEATPKAKESVRALKVLKAMGVDFVETVAACIEIVYRTEPLRKLVRLLKAGSRRFSWGTSGVEVWLRMVLAPKAAVAVLTGSPRESDRRDAEVALKALYACQALLHAVGLIVLSATADTTGGFIGEGYMPFDACSSSPLLKTRLSAIALVYSALAAGLITGVLPAMFVAADCAFGLVMLLRAERRDYVRRTPEERAAGIHHVGSGERARVAAVRDAMEAFFDPIRRTFTIVPLTIIVDLDHIFLGKAFVIEVGALDWHDVTTEDGGARFRASKIGKKMIELWALTGDDLALDGSGLKPEAQVVVEMVNVLTGWASGLTPLLRGFPVVVLTSAKEVIGRDDTIAQPHVRCELPCAVGGTSTTRCMPRLNLQELSPRDEAKREAAKAEERAAEVRMKNAIVHLAPLSPERAEAEVDREEQKLLSLLKSEGKEEEAKEQEERVKAYHEASIVVGKYAALKMLVLQEKMVVDLQCAARLAALAAAEATDEKERSARVSNSLMDPRRSSTSKPPFDPPLTPWTPIPTPYPPSSLLQGQELKVLAAAAAEEADAAAAAYETVIEKAEPDAKRTRGLELKVTHEASEQNRVDYVKNVMAKRAEVVVPEGQKKKASDSVNNAKSNPNNNAKNAVEVKLLKMEAIMAGPQQWKWVHEPTEVRFSPDSQVVALIDAALLDGKSTPATILPSIAAVTNGCTMEALKNYLHNVDTARLEAARAVAAQKPTKPKRARSAHATQPDADRAVVIPPPLSKGKAKVARKA